MNNEWRYVPLSEAVVVLDTLRKPINSKERATRIEGKAQSELYPYYGATGQVGFIDDYITDGEYVLLGEDGAPFLNTFAQKAYLISGKSWVNNHAHILRSKGNNKFLCYYLNYFNYKGYVSGTTRLKLTQAQMKTIPVPVPSVEEQERIVARIEELFSELDNGVETLRKTKQQLAVYRQAVLKKAFEGAYTEQWRKDNKSVLPSCDLDSIKKTNPVYKDTSGDENEIRLEMPSQWLSIRIGDVFDVEVGATPSRRISEYWNGDISWVSSGEVRFTTISETEEYITQEGLDHSSTNVQPVGTIMLAMIGEGKTRGQAAILNIPAAHNQNTAAILVSKTPCQPKYIYYFLQMNYDHTRRVGSGNNQKALNKERVRALRFPFTSFEEQAVIVKEIESRLSVCDNIEKTVDTALQQAEAMRQSILKKAFEGRKKEYVERSDYCNKRC